jgi:hypothetical protein
MAWSSRLRSAGGVLPSRWLDVAALDAYLLRTCYKSGVVRSRADRGLQQGLQMKAFIVLAGLLAAVSAQASCFGSGSFQTCTDSSGNSYNVQRYGNTTHVQGSNPNGSQWNQTSQTYGNTTYHNGTAAGGGSWNSTTTNMGNMQFHNGTDSKGNSFNRTCQRIGNQTFCN